MIPLPWKIPAALAVVASAWAWGYSYRDSAADAERTALASVAEQANQRYRNLEQEIADAQKSYVHAWTSERDKSRSERMRLLASVVPGVPAIHAECPGTGNAENAEMERLDPPLTASETGEAFSAGAELEATLILCQSELRQCAALR